MTLRDLLLTRLGPGNLAGVTLGDWLALLRENRFSVSPSCCLKALAITAQSISNSLLRRLEEYRFEKRWSEIAIESPLFILGHYRHGTTHLQNLLSIDDRFATPNLFQVSYPHTFLTIEGYWARIIDLLVPPQRPFDNVRMGMEVASEDEFAMVSAAQVSPYLSSVFPRRAEHYDRHLTLRDVTPTEDDRWRDALLVLLKKLTLKHQKPLILKSPPHTARIRRLLDMFPDAKFVHIHRNPVDVFQSTLKMVTSAAPYFCLQSNGVDWCRRTIRQYRLMYDAFFDEKALIPPGQYCEVAFERLDEDPIPELQKIYQSLRMPDFTKVEPALRQYLDGLSHYEKNRFPPLEAEEATLISTEWRRSFEEWGYSLPSKS